MDAPHRTLQPRPSSTILFEGDSLTRFAGGPNLDTWPWMRLSGAHYGYPEKVGDWIFCNRPDLNLTCRNSAVGGSILADVLERFPDTVAICKPDIVVMTIGSNDVSRSVPLPHFQGQAKEFCQRLHDVSGGKVFYLGNVQRVPGSTEATKERGSLIKNYSHTIAEVVESHGGLAIDLGSILRNKATALQKLWAGHTVFHDGTHFNMVGNEIIATTVLLGLGLITTPGDPDGLPLLEKSISE